MAGQPLSAVVEFLRKAAGVRAPGDLADRHLLQRFVAHRDEAAFEAIMRRHGPMVLGVCRRVLGDADAADDAFQATFLVLVHKAGRIRQPELLANWLYGVAYRTAIRARFEKARRQAHERRVAAMPTTDPTPELVWRDLRPVLDEEVARLPEKYRVPFVLCYLEGKTNEEAARILGCPAGTVFSRLSWARERLRGRLSRRGLGLSGTLLAAVLGAHAATAAVPSLLMTSTTRAATAVAVGKATAGAIPPHVAALTKGVLRAMFLDKIRAAGVFLLAATLVGLGAGVTVQRLRAARGERGPAHQAGPGGPPAPGRPDGERPKVEPDIAWGEPVNGLRAGLSYGGERRPYGFGESVSFVFTLANVGDRPIRFTYFRPVFPRGGTPTVVGPDGKPARVDTPASDLPAEAVHETLAPGKALELGQPHFIIRPADWAGPLEEATLYATLLKRARGGNVFRVRYSYRLEGHGPGDWSGDLSTGAVGLRVTYEPGARGGGTAAP